METITVQCNVLGQEICAAASVMDSGLHILITGGVKTHIGAVTIAENEDVHTIQRKGHCDAVVTELFARTLLPDANGAVCAACGIHFDNATKEQLRQIMDAVRKLLGDLQTQLSLNAREKME